MKGKKTIKHNLQIEISNIEIDDEYYSFDYKYKENDGDWIERNYDSDHSRSNEKEIFLEELENGYAFTLVLEDISLN